MEDCRWIQYRTYMFYPNRFSCQTPMLECSLKDLRDTVGWKCSSCKTRRSMRDGSYFARSTNTSIADLNATITLPKFQSPCPKPIHAVQTELAFLINSWLALLYFGHGDWKCSCAILVLPFNKPLLCRRQLLVLIETRSFLQS